MQTSLAYALGESEEINNTLPIYDMFGDKMYFGVTAGGAYTGTTTQFYNADGGGVGQGAKSTIKPSVYDTATVPDLKTWRGASGYFNPRGRTTRACHQLVRK